MNRKMFATVLYWIALAISICNAILIVAVQWKPLAQGKALSSFLLPWFLGYAIVAFLIWLVAFVLSKNWKLTTGLFASIGVIGLLFVVYGVTFS